MSTFFPQKEWLRKSYLGAPSQFLNISHSGPVVIFMGIWGLLSEELEGHSFLSLVSGGQSKIKASYVVLLPCDFLSSYWRAPCVRTSCPGSRQASRSPWSSSTRSFIVSPPHKQHWASLNTGCLFCKIKILSWMKYKF